MDQYVFAIVLMFGAAIMFAIIILLQYLLLFLRNGFPLHDRPRWVNDRVIALHTIHLNRQGFVNGIDEENLASLPKMLYSQNLCRSFQSPEGKESDGAEDKKCCTICLSDYEDSEVVRVIPNCSHMFHMACIDEWLRLHATCPVCRTSPSLPSLLSTPLAQEASATTILTLLDHQPITLFPRLV